ncbi:MAG: exodeoxyribonuclease VII small subunit [Clostridiales bacterium]|nr:exodeoxyribonuclease VII small subunit [Clostridiales bacterium]
MDYDKNMKELEAIIQKLESGDVKFDEATNLFERGAELSKLLYNSFEEARGKITVIREDLMGILKEEDM